MAEHSDTAQKVILKAIGAIQLLIGIVATYYGPYEIYVFYLFQKMGLYYDGFASVLYGSACW
jgi:hypothetical protein